MSVSIANVSASLQDLVSAGATWQPEHGSVRVLSGIAYADESPMQSLDLFFPADFVSPMIPKDESHDDNDNNNNNNDDGGDSNKDSDDDDDDDDDKENNDTKEAPIQPRPVFVFIHGGGWSRGGKDNRFYGAPSMCKNMAASFGSISVSIGYRLGHYPNFMHDAAHAIRWVQDRIAGLGGNLEQVFLSGHSAGAHIASLLMIRFDRFLAPLKVDRNLFKGIALLSGVYDLFCPMRKALMDTKNKAFVLAYVMPAFGYDEQLRRDASPLLLLHPEKDTSLLGSGPLAFLKRLSSSFSDKSDTTKTDESAQDTKKDARSDKDDSGKVDIVGKPEPSLTHTNDKKGDEQQQEQKPTLADNSPIRTDLPPTIVLNAWFDMGLEENGMLVTAALRKHGVDATHVTIPTTEHASICWNQKTIEVVSDFFKTNAAVELPPDRNDKNDGDPATCETKAESS